MLHFNIVKPSKTKTMSISWPLESNRYTAIPSSPPLPPPPEQTSELLVPSLYSGSSRNSSPAESLISEHRHSTRRLSWASRSKLRRESQCSYASCGSRCVDLPDADRLPSQSELDIAGDIPIVDADGKSRPFKSLYSGDTAVGEQQMIIFVRHFFCLPCQEYLKALASEITLKTYLTLPVPTSITVIGLGSPALIPDYRKRTGIHFPIFTDPTRGLHKALGMSWTCKSGPHQTYLTGKGYMQWLVNMFKQIKFTGKEDRYKGGGLLWIGGEFLIKEGKMIWCHRMKGITDHVQMDTMKKILLVKDE